MYKRQEELLALMPVWNYRIAKPFKQMLDEGVSLEMYYCIQTLRWYGGTLTMSELARYCLLYTSYRVSTSKKKLYANP